VTITAQLETRIGRSPSAVFAELTALERYPQWLIATGVTGVELLDQGPLAPGTRVRIAQAVAGRATTLEGQVTALEPDRRLAIQGRDREGIKVGIDASVAADGPSTLLRWTLRVPHLLPRGLYTVRSVAIDDAGLVERLRAGRNVSMFRLR